ALVRVARTGVGSCLDVSMLESAITALGWAASNHLIAGRDPVPMGNENATAAPSGTFRTGHGALNIAANKQEQFEAVCRVVGRPDLATDPRFARREDRKTHRLALRDALEAALASHPAEHWENALAEAGVPAARVLDVRQALELDQIAERGFLHDLPHPADPDRTVRVLGNGVRVDGHASTPSAPPPVLGEHTTPLLRELGYTDEEIRALREEGAV
ncbi:CoA transferase, partial [Actinoalloteichus caeruleus]